MSDTVRITLNPSGLQIDLPRGEPLSGVLFKHGIEFPCGGRGRCKGCKVRVTGGKAPLHFIERELLTAEEQQAGWRLACHLKAENDMMLQAQQWDAPVLTDHTPVAFEPRDGLGAAVDIGTTTVAVQLLDLRSGAVLAVQTGLNPQAQHGGDVMSRVEYAVSEDGADPLRDDIRDCIRGLLLACVESAGCSVDRMSRVVLVGNSVMHHLFCGLDITPLSRYPFESDTMGAQHFTPNALGWWEGDTEICFLPCIGGFVGSDILAGLLATGIGTRDEVAALIDIGTNGEMVVGDARALWAAGTAAGPAFEGARISRGMRAAAGAISAVRIHDGEMACGVIGDVPARGICGSGLVDAVAAGLALGKILPTGRFAEGMDALPLCDGVALTQGDIRQLQLAKGAIAAGVELLARSASRFPDRIYLAGAFGNYVAIESAHAIGLLPERVAEFIPAGNTALRGAKVALLQEDPLAPCDALLKRIEHRSLNTDMDFQDIYVEHMSFPQPGAS